MFESKSSLGVAARKPSNRPFKHRIRPRTSDSAVMPRGEEATHENMNKNIILHVSLRVLAVLLGLVFAAAGAAKIGGADAPAADFVRFGYATWFLYLIGLIEFAAGIGLIIPKFTRYAALVLFPVLLGVIGTHLVHDPVEAMLPAFVLLVLIEIIAWYYWIKLPAINRHTSTA